MGYFDGPPILFKYRSSTLFILGTVAVGLFTDLFLYGMLVPLLPFLLENRVNVPPSQIQSYTSAFLAAYAGASVVFSPPAGIIADKLSARQLPFLCGLIALLAATILLHLGQNLPVLIVARILQGLSAAVVWTIGLAMVLDTVGPEKLGLAIGSIFGFISIGDLAAPVLGGVVFEKAGYDGVMAMAYFLLAIDFILRLLLIEKKTARMYVEKYGLEPHEEDREPEEGEDGEYQEPQEDDPLLSSGKKPEDWKIYKEQPKWIKKFPILYCLQDKRLIVAEIVAFMQATLLSTFDATIPTQAESLFGFDSLKSGILFIPLVLPYLILGPIVGKLVDIYGPKPAAVFGFLFAIPSLILLRIPSAGGTSQIVIYSVVLVMNSITLAAVAPPSIVEASYVCEGYYKANKGFFGENGPFAQLYAINSMVFSTGLALGPIISGGLRDSIGYGNMNAVVAVMCAIVAFLSYMYLSKPKRPFWKKK
ncbi:hypothetical protein MMC25_004302 [Agyrium rufum]|nr:hypothetical protein [Agyrium rufum]